MRRTCAERDPELPHWLPDVTLKGLKMGRHRFDIRFWHEGRKSLFEVLEGDPCAVRLAPAPAPGLVSGDTASA